MSSANPYESLRTSLQVGEKTYEYYDLTKLQDARLAKLPYSIRVLLESVVRNCDEYIIKKSDVEKVLNWVENSKNGVEIPFMPARVLLQDFTGVPSVVDLAAMRSAMARLGGEPDLINPAVPADLVVDHSVQVDYFGIPDAAQKNQKREIERNHERFAFLKWGSSAFKGFQIVPPGSGIVHQVNLEYLARVVFDKEGMLYPDSLVGTDSHTTMINGLGVTGWGVGGIEAESVMLGQAITMVLPEVVGFRLTGSLSASVTATDLVLTVVERLRQLGVVGKFVEFFGPGLAELSLADRATIANMAPEYGATMGFFPIDKRTIEYLDQTGRAEQKKKTVEAYLRAQTMFIDHDQKVDDPTYSTVIELDLASVVPSVAGPKRPHDRIAVHDLKKEFTKSLTHTVGFHGFGLPEADTKKSVDIEIKGEKYKLTQGSVVIAAITSCTNTSNPAVMLGAGLVCKKAVERGLVVPGYCKTSLAPGSHVVTSYLDRSGLTEFMDKLGFNTVGYGCTSCIGNSGDLVEEASKAIADADLVAAAVLSGNRNFEGRVHSEVRAAFLASPPLVVAYALAGTVDIDFETEPIGKDKDGNGVFLKDIWPSNQEIQEVISKSVLKSMFSDVYKSITDGTAEWDALEVPEAKLFPWSDESTYIHHPPFFQTMGPDPPGVQDIKDAYVLLNMGDSITTDHISPAGRIAKNSPAAKYLEERGINRRDFNTYGARRGNDEIMSRGTFANVRLVNKFLAKPGPRTIHHPTGDELAVYDAAMRYKEAGQHQILIAGAMYGSGSSRDWAAKGPHLHGVSAAIATSFERIHRSNLVGMGIVPLQFLEGESLESHGLTGKEQYFIDLTSKPLTVGQILTVKASNGKSFDVRLRADTAIEIEYLAHGGILHFVLRKLLKEGSKK